MNNAWLQYASTSNRIKRTYIQGFLDVSGNVIIRNSGIKLTAGDISMNGNIETSGTAEFGLTNITGYDITTTNDVLIKKNLDVSQNINVENTSTLQGNVGIGKSASTTKALDVSGNVNINNNLTTNSLTTSGASNLNGDTLISGNIALQKTIEPGNNYTLDVSGATRVNNNAYFNKSVIAGPLVDVNTDASNASLYVDVPYNNTDASYNVIMNVPRNLYKSEHDGNANQVNYLEINTNNRSILPYVIDGSGVLGTTTNPGVEGTYGWNLGGPGANRFDKVYMRELEVGNNTIQIEDASGNRISMSFDATTGAVNYTVRTQDTADASGEIFVIKGVQTQKISSGKGTIDPSLLEFTGLTFGDTFDASINYNFNSAYTYDLSSNNYAGNESEFSVSSGSQTLVNFIGTINQTTLLNTIQNGDSVVIRVGPTDGRTNTTTHALAGIDGSGTLLDLSERIISVKNNAGSLEWTLWNSENYSDITGNYLHYIELKNINMDSGTYFVAKSQGTLSYNITNTDFMDTNDLITTNGDLYLYIKRGPGKNWTKIPVSLPQSGSIQTQMLADAAVTTVKLADGSVTGDKLASGSLSGQKITDNTIPGSKIQDANITANKIATNAITGDKINVGAINASNLIVDGVITTNKIASGNITNTLMGNDSVNTVNILDDAVTNAKIKDNVISELKLQTDSVTTNKVKDLNITSDKINTYAVTTSKLNDGAITTPKIASGAVDDTKLADNSVTNTKLYSRAVTTAKIDTYAITADKLGENAVTTSKINNEAVTNGKIAFATISNDRLVDNTITSSKLASGLIDASNLIVDGVVHGSKITDASITSTKMADGVISTSNMLGNGIIVSSKLTQGVINNSNLISDGIVTSEKLAPGLLDSISSSSSNTNTTPDGAYNGSYADVNPNVHSYDTEQSYGYQSKISSNGLLNVIRKGNSTYDSYYIMRRSSIYSDWPVLTDHTTYPTFSDNIRINNSRQALAFDIDDNGNKFIALDYFINNKSNNDLFNDLYIYDCSNSSVSLPTLASYKVSNQIKTTLLSADGSKMALLSRSWLYRRIDIADVPSSRSELVIATSADKQNTLFYSNDNGRNWTGLGNSIFSYSGNYVATNSQLWVAVGEGETNTLATSVDGLNWTGRGKIFSVSGKIVKHNGNIWVAVGEDEDPKRNIAYSSDGITWNYPTTEIFSVMANDVIWAIDKWWAVGEGSSHVLASSTDGMTWTGHTGQHSSVIKFNTIGFDGNYLMAGGKSTSQHYQLYYSTDLGSSWSSSYLINNASYEVLQLKTGNGCWMAVLNGIMAFYHSNTPHTGWSTRNSVLNESVNYTLYDNEKWLVIGSDTSSNIMTSNTNYLYNNEWGPHETYGLTRGERLTIAHLSDASNAMFYSTNNGETWTGLGNSVFDRSVRKTYWNKKMWVAVGEGSLNTLATSTDGINWTGKGKIFSEYGSDVLYHKGTWMAVGMDASSNQCIAYSTDDGSTWSYSTTTIFDGKVNGVVYYNNKWWVCGLSRTFHMAYSSDNGATWTGVNAISLSDMAQANSLATDGITLMVGGTSTTNASRHCYTTVNGTTWTHRNLINAPNTNIRKILYHSGRWHVIINAPSNHTIDYMYSTNSGENWTSKNLFTGETIDITLMVNSLIIKGTDQEEDKMVQISNDNGSTWSNYNKIPISNKKIQVMALKSKTNTLIYSSDDGNTWTGLGNTIFDIEGKKVHNANGIWIAVGEGTTNTLAISVDGINWTGKGKIFDIIGYDVYYYKGLWVAVGEHTDNTKCVAYSTDNGSTWSYYGFSLLTLAKSVVHNGFKWFVGGYTENNYKPVILSDDGINWSYPASNPLNLIIVNSMCVDDSTTIVIAGKGTNNYNYTCYRSLNNGDSWQSSVNIFGSHYEEVNSINYINNVWHATGSSISYDYAYNINIYGSWTGRKRLFKNTCYSISNDKYGNLYAFGSDDSINTSIQKSTDKGYNWSPITLTGVLADNSYTHLIVGKPPNTMRYSTNGTTWTGLGTTIFDIECKKVENNGSKYIAVGKGNVNTLAVSDDGINWTGKGKIFSISGNDVAYHGGMWVAVGEDVSYNKCVAYSTDNGSTWSYSVSDPITPLKMVVNAIIRVQGKWIIGGYTELINANNGNMAILASSTDAINWTKIYDGSVIYIRINSLAYDGTYVILASGKGNQHYNYTSIYSTNNGNNWATASTLFSDHSETINKVLYYKPRTRWYGVGRSINHTYAVADVPYSNWSRIKLFSVEGTGVSIDHNSSRIIVTGLNDDNTTSIKYSTVDDPTTSTTHWEDLDISSNDINQTIVIAGKNTDTLLYSIDEGVSWTGLGKTIFNVSCKKTYYANNMWMALGEGSVNTIATSTDGINWVGRGMVFSKVGKDVYYNDGTWVAVGDDDDKRKCIAYSKNNGVTWSYPSSTVFEYTTNAVISNSFKWIIGGKGTTYNIATSYDLENWNISTSISSSNLTEVYSLAYDGMYCIAAAGQNNNHYNYTTYYSVTAGDSWSYASNTLGSHDEYVNKVIYHRGQWILVGGGNTNNIAYTRNNYPNSTTKVTKANSFDYECLDVYSDGTRLIYSGRSIDISNNIQMSSDSDNPSYFATSTNTPFKYGDVSNNIGLQVAVGDGTNTISYSTDDGVTWTGLGQTIFSTTGHKVYNNNNTWIAVGEGTTNTIAVSTDGINWTGKGLIFSNAGYDIHYYGNRWVAVGDDISKNKCVVYSEDNGTTWTNPNTILFDGNGRCVNYICGKWYVGGENSASSILYQSDDGITWTALNAPHYSQLTSPRGIAGNAKRIVIVGHSTTTGTNYKSFYSTGTGTSWTHSAIFNSGTPEMDGVVCEMGVWIVWGKSTDHDLGISTDGTTWGIIKLFDDGATDVHFTGNRWIAVGRNTDGSISVKESTYRYPNSASYWTTVTTTLTSAEQIYTNPDHCLLYTSAYTNNNHINDVINACYDDSHDNVNASSIIKKDDLSLQFKSEDYKFLTSYLNITGDVCVLLGTGSDTLSYSIDEGFTWTGLGNSIFSVAGNKAIWNGQVWVAVGEGSSNTLATSTDGINWTGRGKVFSVRGNNIHYNYNHRMWVAVGEDSIKKRNIAYSTDNGASWSYPSTEIFSDVAHDVTWIGYKWMAVGKGNTNTLAESDDGINWTGSGMQFSIAGYGIATDDYGAIVICGEDADATQNVQYTVFDQYNNAASLVFTKLTAATNLITNPEHVVCYSQDRWFILGSGTNQIVYLSNGLGAAAKGSPFSIKATDMVFSGERWIVVGEDADATKNMFIFSGNSTYWNMSLTVTTDYWRPFNYTLTGNTKHNGIARRDYRIHPIISIPLCHHLFPSSASFFTNISTTNKGFSLSGDGKTLIVGNRGVVQVYSIDYVNNSYSLDYEKRIESGEEYHYGRDVALNYDGSIMSYSYGGDPTTEITEDTATHQIPRVVVYSKDPSGNWNTLPDITLKGDDYYDLVDGTIGDQLVKFISGFGASIELDASGNTLIVASHNNNKWVGIRVFVKLGGVWSSYYKTGGSTLQINDASTYLNDVDITANGQIINYNIGEQVFIETFPNNTELFTNITLAPSGNTAYLKIAQDTIGYNSEYGIYADWFNSVNIGGRIYSYPSSNQLTHTDEFAIQSRNDLSFYTGLPLSSTINTTDDISGNMRMFINETGLVGIGKKSTSYNLDVSGTINATTNIYAAGGILSSSDDRLKDNEEHIENAMETLMKLTPEIYDKKQNFDSTDGYTRESGLIAQDIWYNAPELRHLVTLGKKHNGFIEKERLIQVPNPYYNKWETHHSGVKNLMDESGNLLLDGSGNIQTFIEDGDIIYTYGGVIVDKNNPQFTEKYKMITEKIVEPHITQVLSSDIQDISLNDDIETDLDYSSLGWGDTPASVNYNGIIPYLIKATQEQHTIIEHQNSVINNLITRIENLEK